MKMTWEQRDYDLEFFHRELDSFVPDTIFDAHAHLYELWHWKVQSALAVGAPPGDPGGVSGADPVDHAPAGRPTDSSSEAAFTSRPTAPPTSSWPGRPPRIPGREDN